MSVQNTIDSFYADHFPDQHLDHYLLVGGSKTAWASWLAAASDPKKRTVGLISAAFNFLNFEKNIPYQVKIWGQLSEQLKPYDPLYEGLQAKGELKSKTLRLIRAIDPYYDLDQLKFPKLLHFLVKGPYELTRLPFTLSSKVKVFEKNKD